MQNYRTTQVLQVRLDISNPSAQTLLCFGRLLLLPKSAFVCQDIADFAKTGDSKPEELRDSQREELRFVPGVVVRWGSRAVDLTPDTNL